MHVTLRAFVLVLALTLAACGRPAPVAEEATDTTIDNSGSTDIGAVLPVESRTGDMPAINEADDSGSENSEPSVVIPERYRGRWGMVAADCEPGRSDAKGLLTIGEQTLRFYESVGALQEQRPAIATSFAGVYSFTGEGQTWERVVVLARDGNRLTRTENDQSYDYRRC